MSNRTSTFPLRLPASLKAAIEKMAATDGTSTNQFLVMAAAEKFASIQTAETFFAERKGNADIKKAIQFLSRKGGERPRDDDKI